MEKIWTRKKQNAKLKEYFYEQLESGWNNRFTVLFSKDNRKFHWTQREYFDSEKRFDKFYRDKFVESAALERVKSTKGATRLKNFSNNNSQKLLKEKNKVVLPKFNKSGSTIKKKISVLDYNYLSL